MEETLRRGWVTETDRNAMLARVEKMWKNVTKVVASKTLARIRRASYKLRRLFPVWPRPPFK
jgi:hypothetical protein